MIIPAKTVTYISVKAQTSTKSKNYRKRTMLSRAKMVAEGTGNMLCRKASVYQSQRGYPGKFKSYSYKEPINNANNSQEHVNLGITQHEATHKNILDVTTGNKLANNNNVSFEKLDAIKMDGSFTPQKDPKTGAPILDANGNLMPDPQKGGQYIAMLGAERDLHPEAKAAMKENTNDQAYLDKHEGKIDAFLKNSRKKKLPIKKVGGKDDE